MRQHCIHGTHKRSHRGTLCLLHHGDQHIPLSFGTFKIITHITDPAVCRCLQSIQCLQSRFRNRFIINTCCRCKGFLVFTRSRHADLIIVQMADLIFLHIDLHTAKSIHCLHQPFKTNGYVICHVEIGIHIDHAKSHFRSPLGISSIAFIVGIIAKIQIGISVDRDQTHIMFVHIDRTEHNGITSVISFSEVLISGIYSKKSNIINSCICLRLFAFSVFLFLYLLLYFLIDSNMFCIDPVLLYTIFSCRTENYI